jgi:hypothetical protein
MSVETGADERVDGFDRSLIAGTGCRSQKDGCSEYVLEAHREAF